MIEKLFERKEEDMKMGKSKFQQKMSEVNTLSIELKEEVVLLTFCKNVGWSGVGLYALALAIAGAHLYIAAEYTFYFRNMQVEGVWVFFLLASSSFLLVLYHLVVWKKLAKEVKHRSATSKNKRKKLTLFRGTLTSSPGGRDSLW